MNTPHTTVKHLPLYSNFKVPESFETLKRDLQSVEVFAISLHTVSTDALGAEMTPDYQERTKLYSAKEVCSLVGILLGCVPRERLRRRWDCFSLRVLFSFECRLLNY